MSNRVGEVIEVTYQAKGSESGLTDVVMEIYDETRSKDLINFPDVTMTEIGTTGRYYGTFTPDEVGRWRILINSTSIPGKVVKQYDVISHSIDSIGDTVEEIKDNITSPPMLG